MARKAAKRVQSKNKVPSNAEINAVRELRNDLRDKKRLTPEEEQKLEFLESQLYSMRRAYHAMLARRKQAV